MYTFLFIFTLLCINESTTLKNVKIWGPGLNASEIIMPARYFFIDIGYITKSFPLEININGKSKSQKPCRILKNILDRKDGTYIIRYKLYETCTSLTIDIKHKNEHILQSPYKSNGIVYPEECSCNRYNINDWLTKWYCGDVPKQIKNDLNIFKNVDWVKLRKKVINKYDSPGAVSLCHYVIKNNIIYRTCYGKYIGFKMFMDNILLSLTRKLYLPDVEFFVNLGDWPLVKNELYPIFSWCGSEDSHDIVMPTYDITESTLENMGRVMLDILSVQGNVEYPWEDRIPKVFWRGRDSNRERLNLVALSRKHDDLINASLTNFFFFREEEHIYGPKTEHVSFFKFFDYKYQINMDGTVAAYRFPYLLAGGSLVFKQDSKYYEHFYNELKPGYHYISIKRDLSDLLEKINWALMNDEEARRIAKNGQDFVAENVLPKNIFCYYAMLLNEFSKKISSEIEVLDLMEKVENPKEKICDCESVRDEL